MDHTSHVNSRPSTWTGNIISAADRVAVLLLLLILPRFFLLLLPRFFPLPLSLPPSPPPPPPPLRILAPSLLHRFCFPSLSILFLSSSSSVPLRSTRDIQKSNGDGNIRDLRRNPLRPELLPSSSMAGICWMDQ